MQRIKLILLTLSIISAACTFAPGFGALSFVFIVPLAYGVLYYFLVPDRIIFGPGLTMMNFVLFIRYVIFPPIFKYYGFRMNVINTESYIPLSIYISIVEILTILLAIKFSNSEKISPAQIPATPISKRVPFILFSVAIIAYVLGQDIFANMHFILNPEMIIEEKIELSSSVWVKISSWAQLFIVLFLITFLYSKSHSLILVVAIALSSCMFYQGQSRLSLLTHLLATMFLIVKLVPEKKKLIFLTFISFGLLAMTSLTIVKTFKASSIYEITITDSDQLLNAYVAGIPNITAGLCANDIFASEIGIGTMINDIFRNAMGISEFFMSDNNSVYYFNRAIHVLANDQIVPTTCQGVFYFGCVFFWLPTLLMVKSVLWSDKVYLTSSTAEYVWIFAVFSVAVGIAIPGSFQHLYMNLHYSLLPLLVLAIFNRIRTDNPLRSLRDELSSLIKPALHHDEAFEKNDYSVGDELSRKFSERC